MKIGIIGLGLIGGSLYKSLMKLNYNVIGISQTVNLPNVFKDYDKLKTCDVVFVCTPMNKTLDILDKLESILPKSVIVTDVCSLKDFVCQKDYSYIFIPSHPMAGTENKGFESSFDGLFEGANWVITPYNKKSSENIEVLKELICKLSAKVVVTDSKSHDKAVALISHMPMVISQALFMTAEKNPLALEIAASGFKDMTRLALSNEEMAEDMVKMNSENIQQAILHLYKNVGDLLTDDYEKKIKTIKSKRSKMFKL